MAEQPQPPVLPLRVAVLATSWPRDESDFAGRFLANAVERLEQAGVEFELVTPHRFRHFGLAYGDGVVANARRRPWLVPLFLASMLFALRRVARRCDLVHAHWLLSAPVAAMGGRPFVLTLHGSGSAGRFEDLRLAQDHPRTFGWLVRRAAVVVCVSEPLAEAARAAGARHVTVIPHGVDVPDDAQLQAARAAVYEAAQAPIGTPDPDEVDLTGRPTVLFAGRLSPEKGVVVLAQAWGDGIDVQGPTGDERSSTPARLLVAGDGPERHLLEAVGADLRGFVDSTELQRLYDQSCVVVMPSHREGFGVVALEAMARGVPVVGTRVGGLQRLVEHERTGLLVEPGDAAALRAAIERLVNDGELRARLGRGGRQLARERYGWPAVTAATLDAYRTALRR